VPGLTSFAGAVSGEREFNEDEERWDRTCERKDREHCWRTIHGDILGRLFGQEGYRETFRPFALS
jgi:hypothetical protein